MISNEKGGKMNIRTTTTDGGFRHIAVLVTADVLILVGAVIASAAHAQTVAARETDALEEIIVTAEHVIADAQRTAASVTVRSGEDMLKQGRYSLQSILEDVPGITGGAGTSAGSSASGGTDNAGSGLTIRGIQSNLGAGGSITSSAPAAAVYVDGVYEGVGGSYDIERVEVLRGPEGTLYGRSATSGLVAIHTRDPDLSTFGGNASVEGGNYDLRHYVAAVNLPVVSDVLALRLSGNSYERQGYYNGDGGAIKNTDGRAKLLYQPSESFSLLLGVASENNITHTGGVTSQPSTSPDVIIYAPAPIGEGRNNFRQVWAEMNWNLGIGTLTYLPALRTWWQDATVITGAPSGVGNLAQTQSTPSDDFVTQEIRLASNPDAKLHWQVGGLYYDNHLENANTLRFATSDGLAFSGDTTKSTTAGGLFAQATYPLADTWRVTGGLRYDYTKVQTTENYTSNLNICCGGPPGSPTFALPEILSTTTLPADQGTRIFHDLTYKLRFEHDLTSKNLLYASLSTGFSPGDVSVTTCPSAGFPPVNTPCVLALKDETLKTWEVGSKNRFLDGRLQVNADVFYSDYGAYQAQNVNVGPPTNPEFTTFAVPVQAYGTEFELNYLLTASDRFGFSLSWTNAYYVHKPALFAVYAAEDKVANNTPASTGLAPVMVNLSYDHYFHLPGDSELRLHGDGRYLSSREGDLTAAEAALGGTPDVRIDAQVIGDASATWASSHDTYFVTGYVRNLGNNRYLAPVVASLGFTAPLVFTQSQYDPRTYGLVIGVNF